MNITNNYYQETDYRYTEIGIALNDFIYGGIVKISIPTITPFMKNDNEIISTDIVSTVNIINDDVSSLGIDSYESKKISTGNAMELKVPWNLADIEGGQSFTDIIKLNFNGSKGTRFIITFVGGELNNARIIGRMD